jgi:Ca2+-binding RTX toxin-like protein
LRDESEAEGAGMAWKFPISTNTGVTLGTTDDVYVAEGVVIGVAGSSAIEGTGLDHQVEIYGTIATDSLAIYLHPATNATVTSDILIGETGKAISKGAYSIASLGGGVTIENKGKVEAVGYGVYVASAGVSDANSIVNSGSIYGGTVGIYAGADAGVITKITNTGTVGGVYSLYNGSDNAVVINKGVFSGQVQLFGGDDKYDGRSGTVKALVSGGDGVDTILGGKENNTFFGDAGADRLQGGLGADKLTGGADADVFILKSAAESTVASSGRDTILDFSHAAGDTIDLHSIDARTTKSGDQAFKFIDSQAFHNVAGELRFQKSSTDTFVYGDVNGDGKADFGIKLTGLISLAASDFIL